MEEKPKVVILCGGKGTRLGELAKTVPKPMVEIGGKPLLWHIMKHYAHYGFNEFILCTGYKREAIEDFFENNNENWKIECVDTGLETNTSDRILKIKDRLGSSPFFLATYGDHISDLNILDSIEFHKSKDSIATIIGAHPITTYSIIKSDKNGVVTEYKKDDLLKLEDYVECGFMVLNNTFLNYLKPGTTVDDSFIDLIKDKKLNVYKHEGFFHAMDNSGDWLMLNKMWNSGTKPWCVWEKT